MIRALDETAVVFVFGPAGIGKSTAVGHVARALAAAGQRPFIIDGAAEGSMAARARLADALAGGEITLVDGWEHLPCDEMVRRWLGSPRLPASRLLVAGREPPPAALLALGPDRFRAFEVPPLGTVEAHALLDARGVDPSRWPSLIARCGGNPLALNLLSTTPAVLEPMALGAVIEAFLGGLTEGGRRPALEALAFVPFANEDTLEALLGGEADRAFAWLRRQSFVRVSPWGLHLHEALADALRRDLVWRRPSQARVLVDRVVTRMEALAHDPSVGTPQTRAWITQVCSILLAACPHNDLALAIGRGAPDPLTTDLHAQAQSFVLETFGPDTAALFPRWIAAGARGAVTLDPDGRISALCVWLGAETTAWIDDPIVDALRAELGKDARICVQRFCAHRTLGFSPCAEIAALQDWTAECNWSAPHSSWYVTLVPDPEPWRGLMAAIGGVLRDDLPLAIDRHTLIPHINLTAGPDVLAPVLAGMLRSVWRIQAAADQTALLPPARHAPRDLGAWVRGALPKLVDGHALGQTPLARHLGASGGELQARLHQLIDETATMRPGGLVRNVLLASYGGAFSIDAAAAAHCGMSPTTFKRHKREGLARIVERLAEQSPSGND